MKKCVIIMNPESGKKKKIKNYMDFYDILRKYGYDTEIIITKAKGDAENIIESLPDNIDLVVSGGGDGTLNCFINSVKNIKYKNNILYYSTGSGNDFYNDIFKGKGEGPHLINDFIKDLPIATINGNDTLSGSVDLSAGNLSIADKVHTFTSTENYTQTSGKLTITSSEITLATSDSYIRGGEVTLSDSILQVSGSDLTNADLSLGTSSELLLSNGKESTLSITTDGSSNKLSVDNSSTLNLVEGRVDSNATVTIANGSTVNVTGVSLNKTTLTLTEGGSSKLTATVNPSNATNKNVTWVSSNSNVVSVDSKGNVKALKAGTATITVTTQDGNYKATCQVTVNEKPASYSVIFTPIVQEGTNAVVQYSVAVTKNNSSFTGYKFINYNGTVVKKTLSSATYNKGITSATIRLSDGTDVTATVIYK